MLETVTIAETATFGCGPEQLTGLSQINYLFGSNGTGKTTISRIIADQEPYSSCSVSWENGRPLETFVLNCDFVEKNFGQLRGVFTLGEKQKDTLEAIKTARQELDDENTNISKLKRTLEGQEGASGKKGELAQLEADFQERCWAQKQKHDESFYGAFTGYRNNAKKFKDKVLAESQNNRASLESLDDLKKRAETIFGETPTKQGIIPTHDMASLLAHETNPILAKRVIGKDDVDIAAMIKKLGNSDWVRQGLTFYEDNDQVCPFCQQATTDAFAASLADYFDKTFESENKAIETLVKEYATDAFAFQAYIDNIISAPGEFLDAEKLKTVKATLDQAVNANKLVLDRKKQEPSKAVELESLAKIGAEIEGLIDKANAKIVESNRMVDNIEKERRDLKAQVWRFVLKELELDMRQYGNRKEELGKAISSLHKQIKATRRRIDAKEREIRKLERQTTSIQPTIDGINAILSRFGFESFTLAMGTDEKSYRLVRRNGEDARDTLSEGEKSFVVFLYFYHLLRGSTSEAGITTDRIVVFDDPVSSLDSDILFVVSSLIREVCDDVREGRGHIKQVFVFTHNVYFHREVAFNKKRMTGRLSEETFWIVRKHGSRSKIERHEANPIKTAYELLWMDVRRPSNDNVGMENTLRRILEHYFTILGSVSEDEIYEKFDGQEKVICRSLFSWVHAGSHHVHDDLYVTPSDMKVQKYLRVFREIFERTGHSEHYKMMMGDDYVEEGECQA